MKKLTFKNFNIADWFSFYRIAAAPFLLILIWLDQRYIFSWFLLLSYCTDAIDGFLARKLKITSPRGSQLDSMGDQVTFIVSLIGVSTFEYDFILENYLVIAISLSLYLIQMLIAWHRYGKATAFHTYMAKVSAIAQAVFFLWLLFFGPVYWLFYLMIALGIMETLEEITLIFLLDRWRSDVKGLYSVLKNKKYRRKRNHTPEVS